MYTRLKNIGLQFTPKWLSNRMEPVARSLVALNYKGEQYQCNICSYKLREFVKLESGDKLCPRCGSIGRTRGLWAMIKGQIAGKNVLHFSPSKSLRFLIKQKGNTSSYLTSDYMGEFVADKQYDICRIDEEEGVYDIIICFHVLEHVMEDQIAMSELHRILVPGGRAYIQTPFKTGDIYEDRNIVSPSQRKVHFGQEDHVRIYSPEGLAKRLSTQGFHVKTIRNNHDSNNFNGLKEGETILIATK